MSHAWHGSTSDSGTAHPRQAQWDCPPPTSTVGLPTPDKHSGTAPHLPQKHSGTAHPRQAQWDCPPPKAQWDCPPPTSTVGLPTPDKHSGTAHPHKHSERGKRKVKAGRVTARRLHLTFARACLSGLCSCVPYYIN